MTVPVSVFVIAKNEEDRIPYTIKSVVDWADEVIVIDSGSTDKTMPVCEELGAKTVFRAWEGYGPQKVFGESLCRNDWLLNLDADEALSPALQKEILALFDGGRQPPLQAYHLNIKIQGCFADKPGFLAPSNSPIRFYHKKYAGFKDSTVHDSVVFKSDEGRAGRLQHIVYHRCFRSYSHAVDKINYYTSMQARDMVERGRVPGVLRIVLEPGIAFLKAYFLRRYVFLGASGFVESVIYAFSRTLRLAKARELWQEQGNK